MTEPDAFAVAVTPSLRGRGRSGSLGGKILLRWFSLIKNFRSSREAPNPTCAPWRARYALCNKGWNLTSGPPKGVPYLDSHERSRRFAPAAVWICDAGPTSRIFASAITMVWLRAKLRPFRRSRGRVPARSREHPLR
jgi:hypothetical protein